MIINITKYVPVSRIYLKVFPDELSVKVRSNISGSEANDMCGDLRGLKTICSYTSSVMTVICGFLITIWRIHSSS